MSSVRDQFPASPDNELTGDQDDDAVVDRAVRANAEYIASGYAQLTSLVMVGGTAVLKPLQFLSLLASGCGDRDAGSHRQPCLGALPASVLS